MDVPSTKQFETAEPVRTDWRARLAPTLAILRDRRRLRPFLMWGAVALVVVVGAVMWMSGGRYVSTDNAYVRAPKLMVTTDVSGTVASIEVREGQRVAAGEILFRLDRRPFEIALASTEAQLAQTGFAIEAMKQDYKRMLSQIEGQKSQVALAQANFDRYAQLVETSSTSRANYDQARFTLETARDTLTSLEQQAASQLLKLAGNPEIEATTHPQYLQARAAVDEARRQLERTEVRAPFAGIVTQVDNLQPGAFIVSAMAGFSGTSAVGLVATDEIWIDASVKETEITYIEPGDPVEITIDSYPGRTWTGTVESISPASGAEFSLLPAVNSSGNWVKVVQRIPLRVKIDRAADDPLLRAGMSAVVEIDTGHERSILDLF